MKRILVAEDSPTQAERLRLLLEDAGYAVERVATGVDGLLLAQQWKPDMVISDVVMPEMDGYEFCRRMKAKPETKGIPFVLVTDRRAPLDIVVGLERGADNFITKPFEDEFLLKRLERIFDHLRLRQQGGFEMEVTLRVGERNIMINPDKQQIVELLFSNFEELCRLNDQLQHAQRIAEDYARTLEVKVEERTRQLLQTEKVAAMGSLLAGVAHELNNPLSTILGHASLLSRAGDEKVRDRAGKIDAAASRCARIVRNFLALAREHPPQRERVLVNQLVQEAVELLNYPLRVDDVTLELDLAPSLPVLSADPHQLHQVLVNLMTNAHHALRELKRDRKLRIATRPGDSGQSAVIELEDNGPGIPADIQGRIFDPFFTTKPPGQGTGLGLSLCHGIVSSHGGTITVDSAPGGGARFRIELPVTPARPAERDLPSAASTAPGRKRILVVDDETEVAEVLADLLKSEGHEVDVEATGAAGLKRLRNERYDLIMSDLKMPELDGPGLFREASRLDPALARRFVFLTGDTLSAGTAEFLAQADRPSVTKPFDFDEVGRVVNSALREEP